MQISLLGDADSIVTYLSEQLGWEIPPPAAVVHSPTAIHKPLVADDVLGKPENGPKSLKVPPEKAKWTSYVGEL